MASRNVGLRQVTPRRAGVGSENALTFTSGLTRVGDTITNDLITGKAGGQTVIGGTAASENLTLQSTTNVARGLVVINDRASFPTVGTAASPTLTLGLAANKAGFTGEFGRVVIVSGGVAAAQYDSTAATFFVVLSGPAGSAASPTYIVGGGTGGLYSITGGVGLAATGVNVLSIAKTASPLVFTAPAPVIANNTASTEFVGADFNMSRTSTWATGTLATQREFLVRAPTYAFSGASTITTAATLTISGAPIAGVNATITLPLALWVQAGIASLDGGVYSPTLTGGTTIFQNLTLQSTSHATRGAIVINDPVGIGRVPGIGTPPTPPMFAVTGNVTLASAAGTVCDYIVVNQPTVTITGATNITTAAGFNFVSIEAPVYSTTVTIGAGGTTPPAATLTIKGAPTITGGGAYAGTAGAMGLWLQACNAFIGGTLTATTSMTTPLFSISGTTTQFSSTSITLDPGVGAVTVAGTGQVAGKLVTLTNAGLTALSVDGIVKLLSETAANGSGGAVTLPNFGGTGRPVAGTPAGWWHIQQSGNDRYVPFWGP